MENANWELKNKIEPYVAAMVAFGDRHVIGAGEMLSVYREKRIELVKNTLKNVTVVPLSSD